MAEMGYLEWIKYHNRKINKNTLPKEYLTFLNAESFWIDWRINDEQIWVHSSFVHPLFAKLSFIHPLKMAFFLIDPSETFAFKKNDFVFIIDDTFQKD